MNDLPCFLATVIENGVVVEGAAPNHWIFTVICLVIGLFNLFCPYAAWFISRGWWFQNAEPSDFALAMTRVGGVICIGIGIVYLFL